jgi:hypothetical protein
MIGRSALVLFALNGLVACQTSDDARPTDAGPNDAPAEPSDGGDAGRPRRFRLATTGAQLVVSGPALGLQLTPANVAEDADVAAVHQEFYGIPWSAFATNSPPPAEWAALMDAIAARTTGRGQPVFLSISMLNGTRERLAATTRIENSAVKTDDATSVRCYDFKTAPDGAEKRAAYLRYVTYMVRKFAPEYVNIAIEVNLFFEKCPAATAGVIEVMNAAYDAVKAERRGAVVFPSFQVDHLYGYSKDSCKDQSQRAACFDAHYADLAAIERDRFAMSSYPFLNGIESVDALPADWFARGATRGGERPLIAETGWLSTNLVARSKTGCQTVFTDDEATSAAYLTRVLADAERFDVDLLTWWSDRDLVVPELMTNCPCTFDATWCTVLDAFRGPPSDADDTQFFGEVLLKAFGSMGIRGYSGQPKTAHFAAWSAARERRLGP